MVPAGTILNEDGTYKRPEMTKQAQWEWEMRISDLEDMSREIEDVWDYIKDRDGEEAIPVQVIEKYRRKKAKRAKKPKNKRRK